jgi:putative endonuclease
VAYARLARALRRLLRRGPASADALGRRGERVAARALRRAGYRILARRARPGGVEVDLLCLDGETLVLVEVKATRAGAAPSARVDRRKRRRLSASWRALARRPGVAPRPRRRDVVEVFLRGRAATAVVRRGFAPLVPDR